MRLIAHISDLHFGTEIAAVADGLLSAIHSTPPDILVVSGDLTQRATVRQYRAARAFLDATQVSWLAVPGNHDMPLFDIPRRLFDPLGRFRKYICADSNPYLQDSEIAVLGINTARALKWKSGRISYQEMQLLRQRFCSLANDIVKILVIHHPLIAPSGNPHAVVGRAAKLLLTSQDCSPDLVMAGHLHESYSGEAYAIYKPGLGSTLVLQAGTVISGRVRSEPNSYNEVRIDCDEIALTVRRWNGRSFSPHQFTTFRRTGGSWVKTSH